MIKTRLVGLLSHAKKYIVYTILWQWAALLSQVIAVFTIADLLERVVYGAVTAAAVKRTIFTLAIVGVIRFFCERMGARSSYLACVDVKRILREKIYEKMLKLGASYSEQVSSQRSYRCPPKVWSSSKHTLESICRSCFTACSHRSRCSPSSAG